SDARILPERPAKSKDPRDPPAPRRRLEPIAAHPAYPPRAWFRSAKPPSHSGSYVPESAESSRAHNRCAPASIRILESQPAGISSSSPRAPEHHAIRRGGTARLAPRNPAPSPPARIAYPRRAPPDTTRPSPKHDRDLESSRSRSRHAPRQ